MAVTLEGMHRFKFRVLEEVAKAAYEDKLSGSTSTYLSVQISDEHKKSVRCCKYKDREILRQRVNMAMGFTPEGDEITEENSKCIIKIIEPACDGCDIHKVRITDSCRKCLAQSCLNTCKFNAIYMGHTQAHIDYDKCKHCGLCAKACSYSAIVMSERPCKKVCPTGAMQHIPGEIAVIDEEKCINCGQCSRACPFNAVSEYSMMTAVIKDIINKQEVIAIPAPAIQAQFGNATLPQIFEGIKALGFSEVYETAIGADLTTISEAKEAKEKIIDNKQKMTTSCCPAFYDLLKLEYPKIYKENTSTTVSPMIALGRYIKSIKPNAKVCFIGPCVAKKAEMYRPEVKGVIDYALTFEELLCMMMARKVNPVDLVGTPIDQPASIYGRRYQNSGGVAASVVQYLRENGIDAEINIKAVSGFEVIDALKVMKVGKAPWDLLEGMMCLGGCNGGVSSLDPSLISLKTKAEKENAPIKDIKISDLEKRIDLNTFSMHYKKPE